METFRLHRKYLHNYLTFYYEVVPKCPRWDQTKERIQKRETPVKKHK